jgi:protein CpxP
MTSRLQAFKTTLLAGLLCASAGLSLAQTAPAGGPGPHAAQGAHAEGKGRHGAAKMQARMAQRLAALKAKLQLTAEQEAGWSSFTAAVQPKPRAAMAEKHAELEKLPTPERLDRMRTLRAQHMSEMTQRMDLRADATKAFYATLTTTQKKVFDEQFSHAAGRHGAHAKGHMRAVSYQGMGGK